MARAGARSPGSQGRTAARGERPGPDARLARERRPAAPGPGRSEPSRRSRVILYIRVLGTVLGGLVGIGLAAANQALFGQAPNTGLLLATWIVAWFIVGFALLPYLTVVPAIWLIRRVQELSTAEFVTAIGGLLIGLLMGLLLGLPLSALPEPLGRWLPLGVSIFLGLGMVGLTVAKRADLIAAAEAIGVFRRPEADNGASSLAGEPHIVVDTSAIIDGRIAEIVES